MLPSVIPVIQTVLHPMVPDDLLDEGLAILNQILYTFRA